MQQFDVGSVKSCPPADADDISCDLFRAIDASSAKAKDFQSYAQMGRGNLNDCQSWGLSVWRTIEAAEHARKVLPAVRRKNIVRFSVKKGEGRLRATPSNSQPDHHTFWRASTAHLWLVSQVAYIPGKGRT